MAGVSSLSSRVLGLAASGGTESLRAQGLLTAIRHIGGERASTQGVGGRGANTVLVAHHRAPHHPHHDLDRLLVPDPSPAHERAPRPELEREI